MLARELQDGLEIAALVLYVEVRMRPGMPSHPVVGHKARVGIAHKLLSQHVGAMVLMNSVLVTDDAAIFLSASETHQCARTSFLDERL